MAKSSHIVSLDSARGLAALSVCLYHTRSITFEGRPLAQNAVAEFLFNGPGAVILFFVLSGYVLRLSLLRRAEWPARGLARDFLIARFFRLYPTVVATVALFSCLIWLVNGRWPDLGLIVLNMLLLDVSINGVFWSLQVEVAGSVVILFAFLLERRLGLWAICVMTIALVPLSFVGRSLSFGLAHAGFLYSFMVGYLIAATPRSPTRDTRVATALLVVGLAMLYVANASGFVFSQWRLFVAVIGSALIVLVLSSSDRGLGLLHWAPVRLLGTISYSYYALHPALVVIGSLALLNVQEMPLPRWLVAALTITAVAALMVPVALAMYQMVERPGIRLGRRIGVRQVGVATA